jgi:LEA14-like dessication related protein
MTRCVRMFFCLIFFSVVLASCKVYPPVYKRVENFTMVRIDKEGFKVYGDVILYNPNKIPVKLKDVLMNIELNGKHMATAGQKVPVHIGAKKEFGVPLDLVIKPDMSLTEGLKSIFKIIATKEMDVTVSGVIVVQAMGMKLSIPIQQTEKVDITKLR